IRHAMAMSGGFSGVAVFRATTSDGRELAIRRSPESGWLPLERLRRLYGLLRHISQSGCRFIPVPLTPAKVGTEIHHGANQSVVPWLKEENCFWQIEPWMPGSSLTGLELTTLHLKAALTALDQFHQLARDAVRIVGSDAWFLNATKPSPAVQRRLQIVDELQAGLLKKLQHRLRTDPDARFRRLAIHVCDALTAWLPWLQRELMELAMIEFPIQPVLRDLWRAHVLFTDGEVTGLIDLSAAASDHVTVDLTRLFRSWFGSDVSRVQDAVAEYQLLRILSGPERRLFRALDASTVLLSPVTWLRRRMESGDALNCPDDVIARLTELTDVVRSFRPLILET
ncbi:MAG: phosphotransferase, partial [Fuerstia sp.]|nr:phosphotransferase [Fuerstiella sp.]